MIDALRSVAGFLEAHYLVCQSTGNRHSTTFGRTADVSAGSLSDVLNIRFDDSSLRVLPQVILSGQSCRRL